MKSDRIWPHMALKCPEIWPEMALKWLISRPHVGFQEREDHDGLLGR